MHASPAPDPLAPIPATRPKRRWNLPRTALLGGVLVVGVALGAGGLAAAAVGGGHFGWGGPRLDRIQAFTRRALDGVAATSDQEAKVHDIVAAAFTDIVPEPGKRGEFRKQAIELLKAPAIDKAAVEKLRADRVAEFDARSKRLTTAILAIADVLTPEQRVKLADNAEAWAARGPRHGAHRPGMNRPGMDGRSGDDTGPAQ